MLTNIRQSKNLFDTNMWKTFKKQIREVNADELVFDLVMAGLLSLFQFVFVFEGKEMLLFFPDWAIIMFAYFIQIVLSFSFGQIIHKMSDFSCNKICSIIWSISLFFILFMLLFSGVGLFVELDLSEKTNLILILLSFVFIIFFVGLGAVINDDVDFEEKKHLRKKIIISVLSAIAFAFLNFGIVTTFIGESTNYSFGDFFVFILLMFVTGFLPFRLFMMLAPPKRMLNMIIAFVVVSYEMLILYF